MLSNFFLRFQIYLLFYIYLLGTYHIPDTLLGTRDTAESKISDCVFSFCIKKLPASILTDVSLNLQVNLEGIDTLTIFKSSDP